MTSTAQAFADNHYVVARNIMDPYLVQFLDSYYQRVRDGEAGEFDRDWTSMNGHGDACADAVLYAMRAKIEEQTGLELLPTYSFVRIYRKGDSVGRHKDGPANQVSCTMCVSRDETDWELGFSDGETEGTVVLNPGDGVIYKGYKLDHWREKFTGKHQVQVIVGFVIKGSEFEDRSFYGRGIPSYEPSGISRSGPLQLLKNFLWQVREKFRGEKQGTSH